MSIEASIAVFISIVRVDFHDILRPEGSLFILVQKTFQIWFKLEKNIQATFLDFFQLLLISQPKIHTTQHLLFL